ncbi:unannotated protein [freshwater metagenome]|uniref:Unannotated protein n=1 Tax=freshwater metagenome TaxID=449393 RepID=A0A6J6XXP0_9ZZZZ
MVTMVPRVAAKITVSKRALVSLDTVEVLVRCARTMYHRVGIATKPIMTTKPNGGIPISTLIPMKAITIRPTTTAVSLNVFTRLHNQLMNVRMRLTSFAVFIVPPYVDEISWNVNIHPRFVQFCY